MPTYEYPRPMVTVDTVVFTIPDRTADLRVCAIVRDRAPFAGSFALPGGFLEVWEGQRPGESVVEAARRELVEETGLRVEGPLLPIGAYGAPRRDPRGHVVTGAFAAVVPWRLARLAKAADDAQAIEWVPVGAQVSMAFDHDRIVDDAITRLRRDAMTTSVLAPLLPDPFTAAQLRDLYRIVFMIEPSAEFPRQVLEMLGVIRATSGRRFVWTSKAKGPAWN